MFITHGNLFRLEITEKQEKILDRWVGCCRFVYNLFLEKRKEGVYHQYYDCANALPELKKEFTWLQEPPAQSLQQTLWHLNQAFFRYYTRISEFPKFKKKFKGDSFKIPKPCSIEKLNKNNGMVKLPKIGWVKFRGYRELRGKMRSYTVSRKGNHWYISFLTEFEIDPEDQKLRNPIGIDRGVCTFAQISNVNKISLESQLERSLPKLRKLNKSLSRKKKGSNRRKKCLQKLRKLHTKISNARKDALHKASKYLAKNHGLIVLEDLKVQKMVEKKKKKSSKDLRRKILDQGWFMFQEMLIYKCLEYGSKLLLVDPRGTSIICSECNHANVKNRKSQSEFVCKSCGHSENADLNASKNILKRGLKKLSLS